MEFSSGTELNWSVSTEAILITAQNTSGMLASIALRGYLLWIINLSMALYLFTQTFRVSDYNRMGGVNQTGYQNNGFRKDEELPRHSIYNNQPIRAFDQNK